MSNFSPKMSRLRARQKPCKIQKRQIRHARAAARLQARSFRANQYAAQEREQERKAAKKAKETVSTQRTLLQVELDYTCPACGALEGYACTTASGNVSRKPHAARINMKAT